MVRRGPKQRRSRAAARPGSAARKPVDEAILHLRHVKSAAIVAIAALRRQNCELDEDIARLLQRCVCDALEDQLERLEGARNNALPLAIRGGGPPGPRIRARALAGARTR